MKTRQLVTSVGIVVSIAGGFAVSWQRVTGKADAVHAVAAARADAAKLRAEAEPQSSRPRRQPRNLALQPEALNVARQLGQRFSPVTREQSVLIGTLTIGSEQGVVRVARRQTDAGERVEISLAGTAGLLTWDAAEGAQAGGVRATATDRALIERLVLDSPDQFVLAQLRGASYYTVARNVRPADAGDRYAGPLWDMVRVDDPQADEGIRPQSRWRLYYLNTTTGLIDKIACQSPGGTIEAAISWVEQSGERVPAQITWTREGQVLMRYQLTNFARTQQ